MWPIIIVATVGVIWLLFGHVAYKMVEVKDSDDFWTKEANDQALMASLSFGPIAFAFIVWYKLRVIGTEKKSS